MARIHVKLRPQDGTKLSGTRSVDSITPGTLAKSMLYFLFLPNGLAITSTGKWEEEKKIDYKSKHQTSHLSDSGQVLPHQVSIDEGWLGQSWIPATNNL